jgi:anthranilate synthase
MNPQQLDTYNNNQNGDDEYSEQNYPINSIRVETCPISGTVARGADALEDAQRIKSLIGSAKEESELTMCTDVDRNDKSRICIPGSVKVIGRRQIEMYSRLIHTVDHVEGYLRPEFDSLDAFLCHTWAVTVTGAPKTWAIQFVEDMERSPRCWYGGAVGLVGFDGGLNTGLTLRTVRVRIRKISIVTNKIIFFWCLIFFVFCLFCLFG